MPERWASSCSTVTPSSISGRSSPSSDRAVVSRLERAPLDQRHHGERGEPLGAAGDADAGVDLVRDAVGAVGQPERLGEHGLVADVDPHHPGEAGVGGDLLDVELHGSAGRSTSATSFLGACTQ